MKAAKHRNTQFIKGLKELKALLVYPNDSNLGSG
jgi:hypothetical protein